MAFRVEWERARRNLRAAITRYKERKKKKKREERKNEGINHFARRDRSERIVKEKEEKVEEARSTKDCVKDFETKFTTILSQRNKTKTKEDKKHKKEEKGRRNAQKILKRIYEEKLHRRGGESFKSIVIDISNFEGD
jgi:hypothetical protein